MQFKRMDDATSGINAADELKGQWDDLKAGNLLLWEPKSPSQFNLAPSEKYIVANGHHRFEFGDRQDVPAFNAQVIREADGYSPQEARSLAAEVNIADGKGTIYDQAKFLRNEQTTHGTDAAVARAERIGIKGEQASTIAFQSSPDLYASFINEQITPDQAEAIARASGVNGKAPAPGSFEESLQRQGIKDAIAGNSPQTISNLQQAYRVMAAEAGKGKGPQQFDLFGSNDAALNQATDLAAAATRIQNELGREIRATDAAAKNAQTARAKGVTFDRPPETILAENAKLRELKDQWQNFGLHPELIAQAKGYAEMGRVKFALESREDAGDGNNREQDANILKVLRENFEGGGTKALAKDLARGLRLTSPDLHVDSVASRIGLTQEARAAFEKAFGVKLRWLTADRKLPFSGMRDPSIPNTLFLNAESRYSALYVAGHELLHEISRTSPILYKALDRALEPLINSYPAWKAKQDALYRSHGAPLLSDAGAREELYAGFLGEQMTKPEFWKKLEQKQPTLFNRLATALNQWLSKAMNVLMPYQTTAWFKDIAKAQEVVSSAVASFAKNRTGALPQESGMQFSLDPQNEGDRAFGLKVQASDDISDTTKQAVQLYKYPIETNEQQLADARRLIQAHGLDGAMRIATDPRVVGIPDSVKNVLSGELIKEFGMAERVARAKGDTAGADQAVAKQAEVIDARLKTGTTTAQALQAMKVYGDATPEGIVKHAQDQFGKAGQDALDKMKPVTDAVRSEFEKANNQAIQGTINDPNVNATAKAAVNDAVLNSAEIRKGIIVEITGAFAESPEIIRQARLALGGGELNRILVKNPAVPRSPAILRAMLEDLQKRAAGIAAGHYQGSELGKPLSQKLQERLGISKSAADKMATAFDRTFGQMVEAARKKIPERIAAQRARQAEPFDPNEINQPAVDAEIRRQLRARNQQLGQLVQQHSSVVDNTGKSIADRVVTDSGLTGPLADKLRDAFNKRFEQLATAAKNSALEKLAKQGVKLPKPLKRGPADELIRLTNLGALDDAKWNDLLGRRMDLPVLTNDMKRELIRRANQVQQLPEGFQRDRAATQLLNYVGTLKGVKWYDLAGSIWYAHAVSGLTTEAHLLIDNLGQLGGNLLVNLLRDPMSMTALPATLARGFKQGALQGAEILRSGIVTGVGRNQHTGSPLELTRFKGPAAFLNAEKYITRVISANHVLLFKPAMEMRSLLLARDTAKTEGLSGDALNRRVADLLGNTDTKVNAARAQASAEGLNGLDFKRRVYEILGQNRDAEMPGASDIAKDYALRSTYLQEPYGIAGNTAKWMSGYFADLAAKHPVAGLLAKLTASPFMRIAGNILDEKMNWTPIGASRADRAQRTGEI